MPEPKPIALTQIDSADYSGPAPKPYVVVGDIPGGGGGGGVLYGGSVDLTTDPIEIEAGGLRFRLHLVPDGDAMQGTLDVQTLTGTLDVLDIDRDETVTITTEYLNLRTVWATELVDLAADDGTLWKIRAVQNFDTVPGRVWIEVLTP